MNNSLTDVISKLEALFEDFNQHFYGGELSKPVITVSPDTTSGAYGWCTSWQAWQADKEGHYEINMCAEHLNRPFVQTAETLIHEMVHLLNIKLGVQDTSRSGLYHNKKFKETAEKHGLTVEKDAKYGFCRTTLTASAASWLKSQYPDEVGFTLHRDKEAKGGTAKTSTRKYVCPVCGAIVRTTKPLNIICEDCGVKFEEQS